MSDPRIERLEAAAYTIPTDGPESDGTKEWSSTTLVIVHAAGGGEVGLGYTYGPSSAAHLIESMLAGSVRGESALAPHRLQRELRAGLRDAGQAGLGALALSAVDIALHDLRARLLGLPLVTALDGTRTCVPIYGSGGFTTYDGRQVADQLGAWAKQGIPRVKMKIGRHPEEDGERLAAAREAIGPDIPLMVDANGAFSPDAALAWATQHAQFGIDYFEEPVSSDDLAGLRHIRERIVPAIAVAAGEYSWSPLDALRLLGGEAVDILQADVTRCGGITALLQIGALCEAYQRPFSAHCAPALMAHVGCAIPALIHSEYFHDHVRIEQMLLDGVAPVRDGAMHPDLGAAGHGLRLREAEALPYKVWP
jgi:L-alanine-DL-glutamate epimerase-like enolase superfamily enzyme